MRRITVRRTAVAASAVSLALLVSACGSKDSEAKDEPKAKASSGAPAAPAAKALSKAELEKLVVTEGDLQGYKAADSSKADAESTKTMSADKAECKPLVDVMAMRGAGKPGATVTRKVMKMPAKPAENASPEEKMKAGLGALSGTITADTLGSYEGQGAVDAVAAVKKAGAACAGGFVMTAEGEKSKFTKVEPLSLAAGDESVAFTLSMEAEGGETATTHLVVARKGGTVASFYSLSLAGKAEQPKDVVDTQIKKLG
ncbi:hypothetical protein [Streptomyces griseocarneus]|uniref:hypothetical protein n=1 Tax=Streptomyces griseocarneus TaxID=51201 RepID=UPI00167F1A18|nr:hypothetical protein [Streptomyces griseocarneus]MBZ6475244.1 hypothetical protein [Streptomyces griseocarneus]GHG61453.1 lipoprotein [Streptomyces griseocarneus]